MRRDHTRRARAPGLDGVRALAVLAVMAFHEGLRAAPGGFLGVDVFFVLSGYLITDLLVLRYEASGRLGLPGFWARRARRLLPALAVVLVAVTAAVAVIEPGQLGALRPALLAAVTYSSNWYQAFHHVSYFASFGPPPPLDHLWSLAIEEQFYLVWPLVLVVVLTRVGSRRARAGVAWLGAAASAAAMAAIYTPGGDPSLVYYGTDTHATALLAGAALALTWPLATATSASGDLLRLLDAAGISGLALLAWETGHFSGSDPVVYPFGLALAALAAGGLTVAAAARGAVGTLLGLRPLRWLGVRSYGIYLWHWPVIALATAAMGPDRATPWLWLPESALAILLAAASWKWIEAPILRDGVRATVRSWHDAVRGARVAQRAPVRALPATAAVAMLLVIGTAGYGLLRPVAATGLQRQVALGEEVSASTRAAAGTGPGPGGSQTMVPGKGGGAAGTAGVGTAGVGTAGVGTAGAGTAGVGRRPARAVVTRKVRGDQVTAIGDSVMLAATPELAAALPGIYIDAQVSRQMPAGLAVVRSLAAAGHLRRVVVVGLGTNGTVTTGQIRELLRLVGPHRELVLINTYEARPWEHEVNSVLAAAARRYRNVVLANWLTTIEHRTYLLWGDGVHPRPSGATVYARMVAAAVQATRQRAGSPAQRTRPHPVASAPPGTGAGPVAAGVPAAGPSPEPGRLATAGEPALAACPGPVLMTSRPANVAV